MDAGYQVQFSWIVDNSWTSIKFVQNIPKYSWRTKLLQISISVEKEHCYFFVTKF